MIGDRLIKLEIDRPIANAIIQLAQSGLGTFFIVNVCRYTEYFDIREFDPKSPICIPSNPTTMNVHRGGH